MEEIDITSATPLQVLDSNGASCNFKACGIEPITELASPASPSFNMKALTI